MKEKIWQQNFSFFAFTDKKERKVSFMNKQEFYNKVAEGVKEQLGEDFDVSVQEVVKVNVTLDSLLIRHKSSNVAPSIYLNGYKMQFDDGRSMDSVIGEIISVYTENRQADILVEQVFDFDYLKDKIVVKVIGTDRNEQFLAETPHLLMGDLGLAATLYAILSSDEKGYSGFYLKEAHLTLWKKELSELFSLATENTNRMYHFVYKDITKAITSNMAHLNLSPVDDEVSEDTLYVLYDPTKNVFGASALFLKDKIKAFSEACGCDVYVLPSSIHELILLRSDSPAADLVRLKQMVRDVNREIVSEEEILSDNVFYYCRETDEIVKM